MNKVEVFINHTFSNKVKGFPLGWYKFILPVTFERTFPIKNEIKFFLQTGDEFERYKKLFINHNLSKDSFIISNSLNLKSYGYITYINKTITFTPNDMGEPFDFKPIYEYDYGYDFY